MITKYQTIYQQQKTVLEAIQQLKQEEGSKDLQKLLSKKEKEAKALIREVTELIREMG